MGVIYFNGVPSTDYDIVVEHYPDYEMAAREYSTIKIPGRNGDLIVDTGSWGNVERTYDIASARYEGNFREAAANITKWLNGVLGYARLEDTYDPDVYRLAYFNGGITIENILNWAGRVTVTFNCKPQRFFKTGDEPFTITPSTEPSTLTKALDSDGNYVVEFSGGLKTATSLITYASKDLNPGSVYWACDPNLESTSTISMTGCTIHNGSSPSYFGYVNTQTMTFPANHKSMYVVFGNDNRTNPLKVHVEAGHKYLVMGLVSLSNTKYADKTTIGMGFADHWRQLTGVQLASARNRVSEFYDMKPFRVLENGVVSESKHMVRFYAQASETGDYYPCIIFDNYWNPDSQPWTSADLIEYWFQHITLVDITAAYGAGQEPNPEDLYYFFMNGSYHRRWTYNEDVYNTTSSVDILQINNDLTFFGYILNNPTGQESRPLIRIVGSGNLDLFINDDIISVYEVSNYVDVDSDILESYSGNMNYGMLTTFSNYQYPSFKPGKNRLTFRRVGDADIISKIEVTPRWWVL